MVVNPINQNRFNDLLFSYQRPRPNGYIIVPFTVKNLPKLYEFIPKLSSENIKPETARNKTKYKILVIKISPYFSIA